VPTFNCMRRRLLLRHRREVQNLRAAAVVDKCRVGYVLMNFRFLNSIAMSSSSGLVIVFQSIWTNPSVCPMKARRFWTSRR